MILVCIGGMFLLSGFYSKFEGNRKKHFVVSACILLFLYAAFRAHNLQPDIPVYVDYFRKNAFLSFDEVKEFFDGKYKDPFYHFFAWCFSKVFSDAQCWLAFVSLAYVSSVGILVYKESESPVLSLLAFISLTYFEFSLSGLRQTLAMSLTMLSYFCIKKKKLLSFIVLVLLASLFHKSALIFLIIYPIARTKIDKWHLLVAVLAGGMFFLGESYIRTFMQNFLVDTQYEGYIERTVGLSIAGFVIQACIFFFCIVYHSAVTKRYKHATILYNLAFVGLVFQLFSSMIAEVFRISMYFSFFNILLIPMAISVEKDDRIRILETLGIGLAFVAYMFVVGIPEYAFFWS